MTPILEVKQLRKYFTAPSKQITRAVNNVSLNFLENEVVGLVGESGCGKSTFGRTLVGLHDKTSGEVFFRGGRLPNAYRWKDFRRLAREIQMIFQDPLSALSPRMTVKEIISEGPVIHKLWKQSEAHLKSEYWLHRVGISADSLSRYPHEFSGGQRQRIGIARALALEPRFIVCDEPISALDVSVQAQVVNLLGSLKSSLGLTLLFIAHDLSMVRYISDRIAVMFRGTLVELGPADSVYFEPLHPYTQALIASRPEMKLHRSILPHRRESSPIFLNDAGCPFAHRCPDVMPRCRLVRPDWKEKTGGHFIACHLYEK